MTLKDLKPNQTISYFWNEKLVKGVVLKVKDGVVHVRQNYKEK